MAKTVKELLELYEGDYVDVEVYVANDIGKHYPTNFHTDNCRFVDKADVPDYYNATIGLYELMDEEDYNNSINANSSLTSDFGEEYGDSDAKVLCLMLTDNYYYQNGTLCCEDREHIGR